MQYNCWRTLLDCKRCHIYCFQYYCQCFAIVNFW